MPPVPQVLRASDRPVLALLQGELWDTLLGLRCWRESRLEAAVDEIKIHLWINELSENVMLETAEGEGRYVYISNSMYDYPESRFPGGKYPELGQLAPIARSTTPYMGPVTKAMQKEIEKWI